MGKDTNKTAMAPPGGADAAKVKKRSFELKEKAQDLASDVFIFTSVSQKEYRTSICKKVQDITCEAIHCLRLANSFKIGSSARKSAQQDSIEMFSRLLDLFPVLAKCKCISMEQERVLEKKTLSLKLSVEKWLEKDQERIEEVKAKKSSIISVQRQPSSITLL
ncbi:MAG: hypothetical protein K6G10_02740 [Butyrivibrio sp.]|nr:hypothetical protein [Butyrivibrio sp.]